MSTQINLKWYRVCWKLSALNTHACVECTTGAGHFGHRTLRHHKIGAKVSGHFGTGTKVSIRHFGPTEVSIRHFGPGPWKYSLQKCPTVRTVRHQRVGHFGTKYVREWPSMNTYLEKSYGISFSLTNALCERAGLLQWQGESTLCFSSATCKKFLHQRRLRAANLPNTTTVDVRWLVTVTRIL